ncbi:MAG: hypothetical protein ACI8XM_000633 [Haloarculaceae archaeon]|jgi:hypothetical protein
MPAKTGASHAIASLGSILLGAYISAHTSLVTGISQSIGESVLSAIGVSLHESVTGMLLISTGLAFMWGIAYHFARHGSETNVDSSTTAPGSEPVPQGAIDLPEPLENVVTEPYSSPDSIATADAEVRSHLLAELSGAGSVLDDVHDRLVDAGERDTAERASLLAESVRQIDQKLTTRQDAVRADAVSLQGRSAIVSIHADLVTAADQFRDELDTLGQSVPQDPAEEHFETANRRLHDLEMALNHRERRLELGGSPQ